MHQVFHIVRKDLRRHWPEITVSIALLIAFCWHEVDSWTHPGYFSIFDGFFFNGRRLAAMTEWLLPISWMFLVLRVVQSESLVGDRQFWITKPYDWRSLLGAKLLVIVIAIDIPFLIAQISLLELAGFSPAKHIGGLLYLTLLFNFPIAAPVLVIGSVTRNVVQALMFALGTILYIIGAAQLDSILPNSAFNETPDWVDTLFLLLIPMAVVILQYARRRTNLSWGVLLGTAVAFMLVIVSLPYRSLIDRKYPQLTAGDTPFHFELAEPDSKRESGWPESSNDIQLQLPLSVSGISSGSVINVEGFRIDLVADGRLQWSSQWHSPGDFLVQTVTRTRVAFTMKKEAYDHLKSRSLTLRLVSASEQFRDENAREVVLPEGIFPLPESGICVADREIRCRAPLRGPHYLLVRADPAASTCPLAERQRGGDVEPEPKPWSEVGWASNRELDSDPADLGLSAVREINFYFSQPGGNFPGVCPGSRVTLSNPVFVRRFRAEQSWDGVRLDKYRLNTTLAFTFGR